MTRDASVPMARRSETLNRSGFERVVTEGLTLRRDTVPSLLCRWKPRFGIAAFDQLVAQVMRQDPDRQARHVVRIVDNGSVHHELRSVRRLRERYPNLLLVHDPVHASGLEPIETDFSMLQRKALTPSDCASLDELAPFSHSLERGYEAIAKPFEWKFSRADLLQLLKRLQSPGPQSCQPAG